MADNSLSNIQQYQDIPADTESWEQLEHFLEDLYNGSLPTFATFSFQIDAIDPLAYLEMCWNKQTYQYYWEKPSDEFAIAAGDELFNISASGPDRFEEISRKYNSARELTTEFTTISHPHAGMIFLGGFSFFDEVNGQMWDSFSPASFTVPKWMIIRDGKFNVASLSVEVENFDSAADLQHYLQQKLQDITETVSQNTSAKVNENGQLSLNNHPLETGSAHAEWISSVKQAKEEINRETFEKIVLARHLTVNKDTGTTPTKVLNNLRQQYTNCYNFLIHQPSGKTFLGSTPERLGAFRNQLLLTDALAGSIQRGSTATEDAFYEKHLAHSKKDRDEHNFVIRDIKERLTPYAKTFKRNEQPEIKKLSNVQHLYTPIRVQLNDDISMLDVIGKLHPTPAVGGYPWQDASEYIDKLEQFERGWYAGPVGWFNSKGNGEFAVGIRSGLFTESQAHFFAGCGIVADSDPEAEWEETNLKLKPMLSALRYD